jgi:hypothetical protein
LNTKVFTSTAQGVKMNDVNWEGVYEAILLDIAHVIEGTSMPDEKLETITQILVGNDFMEKPPLYS